MAENNNLILNNSNENPSLPDELLESNKLIDVTKVNDSPLTLAENESSCDNPNTNDTNSQIENLTNEFDESIEICSIIPNGNLVESSPCASDVENQIKNFKSCITTNAPLPDLNLDESQNIPSNSNVFNDSVFGNCSFLVKDSDNMVSKDEICDLSDHASNTVDLLSNTFELPDTENYSLTTGQTSHFLDSSVNLINISDHKEVTYRNIQTALNDEQNEMKETFQDKEQFVKDPFTSELPNKIKCSQPIEQDSLHMGDFPGSSSNLESISDKKETISENIQCELSEENNIIEEEFQDAGQFFKDPSNFQFLENIKSNPQTFMPRDSLYVKFDPLHSHFAKPLIASDQEKTVKQIDDTFVKEKQNETIETEENISTVINTPIDSHLLRESFGNILLSFDSPIKCHLARVSQKAEISTLSNNTSKHYTEEEFTQITKNHELVMQELFLKKQREMEEEISKQASEKDHTIERFNVMCQTSYKLTEVLGELFTSLKTKNASLLPKVKELESENERLNNAIKSSSEDFHSVEVTFSDFNKRFLQTKDLLQKYKDNEESFKENIQNLHNKLEERELINNNLQKSLEELIEKKNSEICNVKKGGDAQIAVLQAQVKKSELKASSLENDLKKVKAENDNFSSICDDLMAKVSES